jgi:methionyl aminopeptidase
MTVETAADIEGLKRVGRVVATCLQEMGARLEPGMTTGELDALGEELLARAGATPAPRALYGFPGATCISVNDEVAHGVPGPRRLAVGDVVNVDVSAELEGYYADTGGTFTVGAPGPLERALCHATRQALREALERARAGAPLNGIGRAIERRARRAGFGTIHDLCGHGLGRALHEPPEDVRSYDEPRDKRRLGLGSVIAIEPFLTTGPPTVTLAPDGWTLRNAPGHRSAQFEHTVIITRSRPVIVTQA